MSNKQTKIIGGHTTTKDVSKVTTYDHVTNVEGREDLIKTHRTHSFKSTVFKDMYFVDSKPYLFACLILYISAIFLTDYSGDSAAFYIRNAVFNLFNRDQGIFFLKRFFLWDFVVQIGLFAIFGSMLFKAPSMFFCFNSHKKFDEESLWISFVRVFFTCLTSSIALVIFFATMQGLLAWVPEFIHTVYVESFHPELFKTKLLEIHYRTYLGWTNSVNLSLIFIFLIRIGVITTILQGLLLRDRRFKLTNPFIIIAVLLPFILSASMFLKPQEYKGVTKMVLHKEEASDSQTTPSEKSADINSSEKVDPSERPKAHITIYDSSTGIIRTNNKQQ